MTTTSSQSEATNQGPSPAVINVRRPRLAPTEGPVVRPPVAEEHALPPTVLRLPNLSSTSGFSEISHPVLSIMHWVALALGGLLALWLIFGNRGGAVPSGEDLPAAPARAQADESPAWNPPPLPTAGDSEAPKWTPPAATASAAAEPSIPPAVETPAPSFDTEAPAFEAPAQTTAETGPAVTTEAPAYDSWPQGNAMPPADSSPNKPLDIAPNRAPNDSANGDPDVTPGVMPPAVEAPDWEEASAWPRKEPAGGPVARTAQREMPPADSAPGGEATPLDLTVPVPQ